MFAIDRAGGLSDAGKLFLKLAAFAVMVVGHADWFLFGMRLGVHDTIGRAVFPAFALVLALNLQRIDRIPAKLVGRLALAAAISTPAMAYLQGNPFPLNILATYAVALTALALWQRFALVAALAVVVFVGVFVDYQWFGVASVLFAVWAIRQGWPLLLVAATVVALLVPINGNLWGLLVLPLVWMACQLRGDAPRLKWLFYVGYPAHLLALAVLSVCLD